MGKSVKPRAAPSPIPHTPSRKAAGLLGGTFDPIHFGHLRLAEEMGEVLGLETVHILPAGQPPHRGQPRADARHRLEMARRAVAGNPRLVLDDREIRKASPSYSVETLAALRSELAPEAALTLFMGADAFIGLTSWHRWTELLDLAHLAVAHRPGFPSAVWEDALPEPLRKLLATRRAEQPADLGSRPAGLIHLHAITQLDISASQIRQRALRGQSLRYLLPDSVIDYINENRLYV
jgi:nicotinate-nucleotide adenylyltransferase